MHGRGKCIGEVALPGSRALSNTDRRRAIDVAQNGLVLGLLWAAYSAARSINDGADQVAHDNAELVRSFQEHVGFAIEPALQQWFLNQSVGLFANSYYLLHFPVTVGILVVTYLCGRDLLFPILRDSLVIMTVVGLGLHLAFPLAPPRMLDGVVDASVLYGPNPYALPGSEAANELAAMPSMHVAWAIAFSWTLFHLQTRRNLGIIAVLHPLITLFVVLVTGHHFLSDVIVGSFVAFTVIAAVSARHLRADAAIQSGDGRPGVRDSVHTLSTN